MTKRTYAKTVNLLNLGALLGLALWLSAAHGQTSPPTIGPAVPTPLPEAEASPSDTSKQASSPSAGRAEELERSPSSAQKLTKPEILARLRELQKRQVQAVNSLDELIKRRLADSTSLNIKELDTKLARQRVAQLGLSIEELSKRRAEFAARRDFVDQLILQFDTKWTSQPLKTFFEQQLLEMAGTDLSDPRNTGRTWKFLTYLSIAIREVTDSREDILALVEGYMNFGGVTEPGNPADFLASRHYTNGSFSTMANPVDRENVGEHLEIRMRELGIVDRSSQKVELKTQVNAPTASAPEAAKPLASPPPAPQGTN